MNLQKTWKFLILNRLTNLAARLTNLAARLTNLAARLTNLAAREWTSHQETMPLTNTQLWIISAALILGLAVLAYGINRWALKGKFSNMVAAGVGAVIGAASAGAIWYFQGKKETVKPVATLQVNADGDVIKTVTPEAYITEITQE